MNLIRFVFCMIIFLPATIKSQVANHHESKDFAEWAENKGQWDSAIFFRTQQNALDLQIGENWIQYYFYDPKQMALAHKHGTKFNYESAISPIYLEGLQLQFEHAKGGKPVLLNPKPYYYNFYQGNQPKHWANQVRVSNEIGITNLYPNIDLKVHSAKNQLKYEFFLNPGSKLNDIVISANGAKQVYLEYGNLFIETQFQTLKEQKPYAYQIIEGKEIQIPLVYSLSNQKIGFVATEGYNPNYQLIIDPEIIFLTYSGSEVDNFGCTATSGENGTMYAAGVSTGPYSINPTGKYPVTAGSFQINYAGGGIAEGERLGEFPCDITFSKYSSDGSTLLYASYLGGSHNEIPHSLIVDNQSNLILLGNTYSNNFPVTASALDTSHNGRHDLILSKFSPTGNLLASTYMGGPGNDAINFNNGITNYFFADSYRGDVIADDDGNILVATVTQTNGFPATPGCIQDTLKGFQDGIVFKIKPDLSKLIWSTYLGGDAIDAFYSIDIGENGQIYLSGGTQSTNFPKTAGSYQPSNAGGQTDGIIVILDSTGNAILHSSYFGTNAYDQIFSLDIDKDNLVYIVGQSLGNIPISQGVYSNPNSHQFLACLNPDLTSKIWSTVFGSGRPNVDVTINAFQVDDCKRIYVSSWGGKISFRPGSSTFALPVTTDAYQPITDGSDFYLMLLNKNASKLLYATFLGGDDPESEGDHVDGGTSRYDKKGVVYQSMCASCPSGIPAVPLSDLKTTANSFSPNNKSPRCSNAALKFDFRVKKAGFAWEADTCAGIFTFKNTTQDASNFLWTFPDGETSMLENPSKQLAGKYFGDTITLIVEFGTNCADTAYGFVSLPDSTDKLTVPNVFTPNGDGTNDYFRIAGVSGQCNETDVYIYNRWGQLFFEDHVSFFRWDGRDQKGVEAPEGVYFYLINTKKINAEESQELHGTISLIR